jgi:haloalkane dehalogenase
MIPSKMPYQKKRLPVNGYNMSYVQSGTGDPIVFLHGNPTSSYLWRNIIPYCESLGRCIAPDLIGMGDSDKLSPSGPDRYSFVEHRQFLDGLLESLGVDHNVTLVVHDWGSALGFDWANRHRDAIAAIAYMEALVKPLQWSEWPKAVTPVFRGFRSPAGEAMVLENNVFIEQVLPGAVIRKLTDEEMSHYRAPFDQPGEDRRPTLSWPRQIPIDGKPEDVVAIVDNYSQWLSHCDVPKLFINANPGAILRGEPREFCRRWPNQTEITVLGSHFIQEDSPDEIGLAIADWITNTVKK